MARARKRKRYEAYSADWTPAIAALFGLVPPGLIPPAKVRCHPGKAHLTIVAGFRDEGGLPTRATIRLERDGAGAVFIASSELSVKAYIRGVA